MAAELISRAGREAQECLGRAPLRSSADLQGFSPPPPPHPLRQSPLRGGLCSGRGRHCGARGAPPPAPPPREESDSGGGAARALCRLRRGGRSWLSVCALQKTPAGGGGVLGQEPSRPPSPPPPHTGAWHSPGPRRLSCGGRQARVPRPGWRPARAPPWAWAGSRGSAAGRGALRGPGGRVAASPGPSRGDRPWRGASSGAERCTSPPA